ncbi:MAG: hypothetical protein JNL74_14605, partial [Fibrobacteres bacterium]|nr:hypothetical protein [Fibrobacterota bacterium]
MKKLERSIKITLAVLYTAGTLLAVTASDPVLMHPTKTPPPSSAEFGNWSYTNLGIPKVDTLLKNTILTQSLLINSSDNWVSIGTIGRFVFDADGRLLSNSTPKDTNEFTYNGSHAEKRSTKYVVRADSSIDIVNNISRDST